MPVTRRVFVAGLVAGGMAGLTAATPPGQAKKHTPTPVPTRTPTRTPTPRPTPTPGPGTVTLLSSAAVALTGRAWGDLASVPTLGFDLSGGAPIRTAMRVGFTS